MDELMAQLLQAYSQGTQARSIPGSETAEFIGPTATDWKNYPDSMKFRDPWGDQWMWRKPDYQIDPIKRATFDANLGVNGMTLKDLVTNWSLYKSYPEIANTPLKRDTARGRYGYYAQPTDPYDASRRNPEWGLGLQPKMNDKDLRETIEHEAGAHAPLFLERKTQEHAGSIANRATVLTNNFERKLKDAGARIDPDLLKKMYEQAKQDAYRQNFTEMMARAGEKLAEEGAPTGTDWRNYFDEPQMWTGSKGFNEFIGSKPVKQRYKK